MEVFVGVIWLEILYNEKSSILCTNQSSGAVFGRVLERQSRKLFVHQDMGCNSKNIGAAVKTFQCRVRPNFFEYACQKSCESKQNWISYGQKETTFLKEAFLQVLPLKQCYIKHVALIMQIIHVIINMDNIRQERSNEGATLK